MSFVADREPKALWGHFDTILTIPRGSKEEQKIREYVLSLASRHGLEYRVDAAGNVVVRKPASPGREDAAVTVLQSHLDMVNEKNSDVEHDFSVDPIRPALEGEYLKAQGTTLGADNGIGVAAMLAILEDRTLSHGPLELLFTVDEETGLTGARGLDGSMLRGRRLLNLDSEEEGTVTVGCAGGADTEILLPLETLPAPSRADAYQVQLCGLHGGHSGLDIHLQRGNAIQLLARMLHSVRPGTPGYMAALEGGNKHNAIPREARATVVIPEGQAAEFLRHMDNQFAAVWKEYRQVEPDIRLEVSEGAPPEKIWSTDTAWTVFRLLVALPHGVAAMSHDIPGLVETSSNLAVVRTADGMLKVLTSSRSSVATALDWIRSKIRAVALLAGARVEEHEGYPGWTPNVDSPLLKLFQDVHRRVAGSEARVVAVHAGLECGIIGEKVPGMDMISFGPQIEFPHSPRERVHMESVGRFYHLLTTLLEEMAGR